MPAIRNKNGCGRLLRSGHNRPIPHKRSEAPLWTCYDPNRCQSIISSLS